MELILDKNKKKEHLYLEVFHYYRELIMEKKLPPGSRMPSLRKCSQELKLSRTTIENAYLQLAANGETKYLKEICDITAKICGADDGNIWFG